MSALRRILLPWKATGADRARFIVIALLFLTQLCFVEKHTAFKRPPALPMTDLGTFLRVGWAVRTGEDIYQVTDWHGWHYNYPPFTAIAFTPLALPPSDVVSPGFFVPFGFSVAIWYLFSAACVVAAADVLAHALQTATPLPIDPAVPADRRRWWMLRSLPILVCIGAVSHNLARGQMESLVLLLIAAAVACTIFKCHFRAGLLLGLAASIKLFPVFLLIYPLWRRNFRCLAGAAAAMVLTFVVLPVAVFGPVRTTAYYHEFAHVMISPNFAHDSDSSRLDELYTMESRNSQSLLTSAHNLAYIATPRDDRPLRPSGFLVLAVRAVGLLLLAATLWAAGWRRDDPPPAVALFFGALMTVALLILPISHSHYVGLMMPLFMGVIAWEMVRVGRIRLVPALLMFGFFLCDFANRIETGDFSLHLRDLGIPALANLVLWALAIALLRSTRNPALTPNPRSPLTV